jgi:hypothetical protein
MLAAMLAVLTLSLSVLTLLRFHVVGDFMWSVMSV